MTSFAITYTEPELAAAASNLAQQLQIPLLTALDPQYHAFLQYTREYLQLLLPKTPEFQPLYIDFLTGPLAYRQQQGGGRSEALARAVGIKSGYRPSILDATAGLGRDSFLLAALGCKVQSLERSPIIGALLADGLARARQDPHWQTHLQMDLKIIDAQDYLKTLSKDFPEVIYLDPMFPPRKQTALVKKEMRMLREIVGDDQDMGRLFALAYQKATKRVVVKRHKADPWISERAPSYQLQGKTNRFDVYLIP